MLDMYQLLGRAFPEGLLFTWAIYYLSKTKIQLNRYLLSSAIIAVLTYLVTLLPIQLGINTLLSVIVIVFSNILINKFKTLIAIQYTIGIIITEYICEIINLFIIVNIFKVDVAYVLNNPLLKMIYTLPSLLMFIVFNLLIRAVVNLLKNKRLKNIEI